MCVPQPIATFVCFEPLDSVWITPTTVLKLKVCWDSICLLCCRRSTMADVGLSSVRNAISKRSVRPFQQSICGRPARGHEDLYLAVIAG
jgi:hypothetical protein